MTTFSVTIEGVSGLLMHRWEDRNEEDGDKGTRAIHISDVDRRTQAEGVAYRHHDGTLYIPGSAISRLMCEAGGAHKQTGSRKSLKFVVPAAVLVLDDIIPLVDANGHRITDFEIDSRPVVIPATKGRIMRHRPRIDKWRAEFAVEVDRELMEPSTALQLLTEGGKRLGILDYRPEKRGPFGRFHVINWAELKADHPAIIPPAKKRAA